MLSAMDNNGSAVVDNFEPTGLTEASAEGEQIVIVRELHQNPEVIWDFITDIDDLERWYGSWRRIPDADQPTFELTTWNGEETYLFELLEAQRPEFLRLKVSEGSAKSWEIRVYISSDGDGSVLEFQHTLTGIEDRKEKYGPLWEYKLDRLMIALSGGDLDDVQLGNYYPCMAAHYSQVDEG